MRGCLRTILMAALVVLVTGSRAGANTITFSDVFSPASPLWTPMVGTWSDAGGVYAAATNGSHTLLPFTVTDFSIDVDINGARDGGVWLRTDANFQNAVLLVVGGFAGAGSGVYFHSFTGGAASVPLAIANNLFAQGQTVHAHVDVTGDTYSVYLNNVFATQLTTTAASSGLVGLYDNWSGQSFDNFVLEEPTSVPEPGTWMLVASGATALVRRRRRTA